MRCMLTHAMNVKPMRVERRMAVMGMLVTMYRLGIYDDDYREELKIQEQWRDRWGDDIVNGFFK